MIRDPSTPETPGASDAQPEIIAYPDCRFCGGRGFVTIAGGSDLARAANPGQAYPYDASCGNCIERRRWEGLERTEQRAWLLWRPDYDYFYSEHDSREKAETAAARLARLHPGKTFIVFEKLVNIRTLPGETK